MKKISSLLIAAAFCSQLFSGVPPRHQKTKVTPCVGCDLIIITPGGGLPLPLKDANAPISPGMKISWNGPLGDDGLPKFTVTVNFPNNKLCGARTVVSPSRKPYCVVQNVPPGEYFYTVRIAQSHHIDKGSVLVTPAKPK